MKTLHRVLLLLCLLWSLPPAAARATPSVSADPFVSAAPRPTIGLALSGGAALGVAHLGVLQWFDEHHIPVDYVAGTSMGGLVGGFYSMGVSPAQMRVLLKGIDWNDALSGGPAYKALSFRRKQDLQAVPSRFELGLRGGLSLPGGLIPANPIGLLLSQTSLPYSDIPNFDALPIPFRCVALDMGTGKAETFGSGSLATALRATMAIPALFTPVERGGHLFTDGGSVNNTPTEAVRAMGADIIIAVDLSGDFLKAKQPASLVGVLSRTVSAMTYANERQSLQLADIVLTPDLGHYNAGDFAQVDALAAAGYKAAQAKARILQRFALSDADWQNYLAARNARVRRAVPAAQFVQTVGVPGQAENRVQARLAPLLNRPLDTYELNKVLTDITAAGRFESFLYSEIRQNGAVGLQVDGSEKQYGPPFLRLGLSVDGADVDYIRTNLTARVVTLDAGSAGAETRTDIRLGSDRDAAFEYYRPLSLRSRVFFAPRVFTFDNKMGLYNGGSRDAQYGVRTVGVAADAGYNTGRLSEARLGVSAAHEEASVSTGSPLLPSVSGTVDAVRAQWTFNGLNALVLPSNGERVHVEINRFLRAPGSTRPFTSAQMTVDSFRPARRNDIKFLLLGAGTTFGSVAPPLQQFTVGGPLRLGAYRPAEFRGNDYALLKGGYLYQLTPSSPLIGGRVLAGGWVEGGGAFSRFGNTHSLSDIAAGIVADTILGPVVFTYSYGEAGRRRLSFTIGSFF